MPTGDGETDVASVTLVSVTDPQPDEFSARRQSPAIDQS